MTSRQQWSQHDDYTECVNYSMWAFHLMPENQNNMGNGVQIGAQVGPTKKMLVLQFSGLKRQKVRAVDLLHPSSSLWSPQSLSPSHCHCAGMQVHSPNALTAHVKWFLPHEHSVLHWTPAHIRLERVKSQLMHCGGLLTSHLSGWRETSPSMSCKLQTTATPRSTGLEPLQFMCLWFVLKHFFPFRWGNKHAW